MKIFYAVQATGNGHISRAREIIPILSKFGEVDVFLSGNNYSLKHDFPVAYRSKGLSLQYDKLNGKVNVKKTLLNANLKKIWQEANQLPIEKYNLIINDFECITAISSKLKKIPCIHFGHQASFYSEKVPRPIKRSPVGELILKHYAQSKVNIGLHFEAYDKDIFNPIIKEEILKADPKNNGHITVYLGHLDDGIIEQQLNKIKDYRFEVFSGTINTPFKKENIQFYPANPSLFNHSMINCEGIITGGGFETPAEALYLGKKIMVCPMIGQYEQLCNAAALKIFGVQILEDWNKDFLSSFEKWMNNSSQKKMNITHSTEVIVEYLFSKNLSIDLKRKKADHRGVEQVHQLFQSWEQTSLQSAPISSPEYKSIRPEQ